jgi:5-methyltetrahydrofolate--homocysteine methyltransferase
VDEKLNTVFDAVLNGDMDTATEETQAALDSGIAPGDILQKGLIPAMDEVGRLFEANEFFVPEMLIAARAMQAALGLLKPLLIDSDIKPAGIVVIGTVKGDLHDIGKNLVAMMLEGAGFEINDLGTDVPPEQFVEAVNDTGADLLGLSALLTTTLPMMETTIDAIEAAGLRDKVKIIIGGAPVTPDLVDEIGADGYAPDASQAASLAKKLIA